MNSEFERKLWEGKVSDIALNDPFSEKTNKARKQVIILSSLLILNHMFPLDLDKTHVFGVHFKQGSAPPFSGILALLVVYFAVTLVIYSYHEIKAWLAQCNTINFSVALRNLHDIYAHHQAIANAVDGASTQLRLHREVLEQVRSMLDDKDIDFNLDLDSEKNSLEVHEQSFENMFLNLGDSNETFRGEILKGQAAYRQAVSDFRAALFLQTIKVGLIEVIFPFSLVVLSIYVSHKGIFTLLHRMLTTL